MNWFQKIIYFLTVPTAYHCKPLGSKHEWLPMVDGTFPVCRKCGDYCWWMDGYKMNSGTQLGPDPQAQFCALMYPLQREGYTCIRVLKTGKIAALHQMAFTTGLCVGLDLYRYEYRYCYENYEDAGRALANWDGLADPPGPWIKLKGHPNGERLGPGAAND